jgi:hypothetical protein
MRNETNAKKRDGNQVLAKSRHFNAPGRMHLIGKFVTGAGIKNNNDTSFEESLLRICKYYRNLYDVMVERSGNQPNSQRIIFHENSNASDFIQNLKVKVV